METTFITIHDLSPEARILYSSDSIVDILGHTPEEVVNRSCWDFFHPDELPLAQNLHSRGINFDKAAVLAYCSLRNRQQQWICCECCFTIAYDVMVVCTSVYRRGIASEKRAVEAPIVRRLFSTSPKDPRYHMLSHLSGKFDQAPKGPIHEPRAALFLNRFTRTLTIMYATAGIERIVGISGEEMKGKSFYYCIQENCLDDAVRCLESAKGNDSIAYLRFWFRDPRIDEPVVHDSTDAETDTDVSMTDTASEATTEDGRSPRLRSPQDTSSGEQSRQSREGTSQSSSGAEATDGRNGTSISNVLLPPPIGSSGSDPTSRTSSGASSSDRSVQPAQTYSGIFGEKGSGAVTSSGDSSPPTSPDSDGLSRNQSRNNAIELEAVVSCATDGLVVCLRRARPVVPTPVEAPAVHQPTHANGIFAAPWGVDPVFNPSRPNYKYFPGQPMIPLPSAQTRAHTEAGGIITRPHGPPAEEVFNSIRDVALFAWALTGINGSLASYARNPAEAKGESQPPDGLAVWDGGDKPYQNNTRAG